MPRRRAQGPLVDDADSWGEALQKYAASKATRPMPAELYAKPKVITRAAKAREEVEYNPVLQTFTGTGREANART